MNAASSRGGDSGGLTLVMNAAEGLVQIGLADEQGRLLFTSSLDAPSRGVEVLTASLASALDLLGRDITQIERIAVVRGPGSFTGIRLTAATAAGLARSVGARMAGLDFMRCLAMQCLPFCGGPPDDAQLWVLVRARRDLVYAQAFVRARESGVSFHELTDLAVLTVSSGEAARRITETAALRGASRVLFAGSGSKENKDMLAPAFSAPGAPRPVFLDITAPWPDTLLAAARDAVYGDADIEPLYVRASDAETNLPQIARRLGQDPDEAVRQLAAFTRTLPESGPV